MFITVIFIILRKYEYNWYSIIAIAIKEHSLPGIKVLLIGWLNTSEALCFVLQTSV